MRVKTKIDQHCFSYQSIKSVQAQQSFTIILIFLVKFAFEIKTKNALC